MASFKAKQVPQSAFVVYLFWGITASILYADTDFDLYYAFACLVTIAFGLAAASVDSESKRGRRKKVLSPSELRGIKSTLGPVPVHQSLPPINHEVTSGLLKPYYPPNFEDKTPVSLNAYLAMFGQSHPHYAALFDEILGLLTTPEHLLFSASYDIDATTDVEIANTSRSHGNRSLLTHSLLVFTLSMLNFESYCQKYAPEKPKRANKPDYKPDPKDPLVGILGLAHDLGKLLTFKLFKDETGKLIVKRIFRHHDAYGSQVMARLPGFWHPDISAADRDIIQNILACYHHPKDLPYTPATMTAPERDRNDREVALLRFLIESDKLAGALEAGMAYNDAVDQVALVAPEQEDVDKGNWVDLLVMFLATNKCINLLTGKSLAFKTQIDDRVLLIFDEAAFIAAFCDFIKQPAMAQLKTGNNPHPVTSNLLVKLDALDVVYRPDTKSTSGRSPELNIFKISLLDQAGTQFAAVARTFTLDITNWAALERLKEISDSHVKIVFESCRFGVRGARKDLTTDAINEEVTGEHSDNSPPSIFDMGKRQSNKSVATKQRNQKQQTTPAALKLRRMVAVAITAKTLIVEKEITVDGKPFFVFVGQDTWFTDQGYSIDTLKDPSFMAEAQIIEIKPSKTVPLMHVITISK